MDTKIIFGRNFGALLMNNPLEKGIEYYAFCFKICCIQKQPFGGVLLQRVLSEILQNSQANTCVRVSLKNRLWHRCFPANFAKFPITPFLENTSGRLLLTFSEYCQKSLLLLGTSFKMIVALYIYQILFLFSQRKYNKRNGDNGPVFAF